MPDNEFTYKLTGKTPAFMHNGQLANPLNVFARRMKEITSKGRKKTDEDLEALSLIEWEGGLYFDEEIGPYWPAENIEAMIRTAARGFKRGPDVQKGVQVVEAKVALDYDGPRDKKGMLKDGRFLDIRRAKPPGSGGTVMRARPIFYPPWSVIFTVLVRLDKLNEEDVHRFLVQAGKDVGLSDRNPRYGLFDVQRLNGKK